MVEPRPFESSTPRSSEDLHRLEPRVDEVQVEPTANPEASRAARGPDELPLRLREYHADDALEESDYVHLTRHLRHPNVSHAGIKMKGCWMTFMLLGLFKDKFDIRLPVAASWFNLSETGFAKLIKIHPVARAEDTSYGPQYDAKDVLNLWDRVQKDPTILNPDKRNMR
jgi:hypothetical protein